MALALRLLDNPKKLWTTPLQRPQTSPSQEVVRSYDLDGLPRPIISAQGHRPTPTLLSSQHGKNRLPEALDHLKRKMQQKGISEWDFFQAIDADKDGEISRIEMQRALRQTGCYLRPPEMDIILQMFDTSHNGGIDFTEFHRCLHPEERFMADPSLFGFEVGSRVKSLVHLWSKELANREIEGQSVTDVGTVLGPGVSENTIMVRFDRGGLVLCVKPKNLALLKKDSAHKQPQVGMSKSCSLPKLT